MSIRMIVKNAVLAIPSSLVDTHDFSICEEWEASKTACYYKTSDHTTIRIPVQNLTVVKVASGIPPGAGSFVAFQPWLVFSKKGDTLYIIPAALNKETQAWEYYAIDGYEEVYILFVVIDVTYKETAQIYDASFNLLVNNAVLVVEFEEGKPLFLPEFPLVPILAIVVAGVVGGLATWGWVQHAEAEKKWAEAEAARTEASKKLADAIAEKIKQTQDVKTAMAMAQAAGAAITGIVASTQKPQSNSNDWFANVFNFLKSWVIPIAGIFGLLFVMIKFHLFTYIIDAIRSVFRRRRE